MEDQTHAAGTPHGEVILRTINEGGTLTLTALRTPQGWTHFTLVVDETAMADRLGYDAEEASTQLFKTVGPADTWKGALELLDNCFWEILHPDYVHPEFRRMVTSAVRERAADLDNACAEFVDDWLPGWERTCSAN